MKIVLLPAANANALSSLQGEADHSFEETCEDVQVGGTLKVKEDHCYTLHFAADMWQSLYKLDTTGVAYTAIFAEHVPTEFEQDAHYLKDDHGDDIEPLSELPEKKASAAASSALTKRWGEAMAACIMVVFCTLIGVVFLVPAIAKMKETNGDALMVGTNGFAAGALLAAAFYLMLFEATHLIVGQTDSEPGLIAWWGSATIFGYITPFIIEMMVFAVKGDAKDSDSPKTSPEGVVTGASRNRKVRVLSGVLLGDLMHNLVDGIILGAAFSGCSNAMGWKITAGTVAHELAQEVADYIVLTDPKQGGLKPAMALGFNFLSGLSIILGAIIVLASNADNNSQALTLAYGGGIYIQIATTECMPRMHDLAQKMSMRMLGFFCFVVGTVAIGLVLMYHEHCVPAGSDAHAGHNHGR